MSKSTGRIVDDPIAKDYLTQLPSKLAVISGKKQPGVRTEALRTAAVLQVPEAG
jgi:hypothetical protein